MLFKNTHPGEVIDEVTRKTDITEKSKLLTIRTVIQGNLGFCFLLVFTLSRIWRSLAVNWKTHIYKQEKQQLFTGLKLNVNY